VNCSVVDLVVDVPNSSVRYVNIFFFLRSE
jgi:hypothetical protein